MFRFLTQKEQIKHGCIYCTNVKSTKKGTYNRRFCLYDSCPYKDELDNYRSYEDYFKAVQERNEGLSFSIFSLFDHIPNVITK